MKRKNKAIERQLEIVKMQLEPAGNIHSCFIEMYKLMNLMYRYMQDRYEKTDD